MKLTCLLLMYYRFLRYSIIFWYIFYSLIARGVYKCLRKARSPFLSTFIAVFLQRILYDTLWAYDLFNLNIEQYHRALSDHPSRKQLVYTAACFFLHLIHTEQYEASLTRLADSHHAHIYEQLIHLSKKYDSINITEERNKLTNPSKRV